MFFPTFTPDCPLRAALSRHPEPLRLLRSWSHLRPINSYAHPSLLDPPSNQTLINLYPSAPVIILDLKVGIRSHFQTSGSRVTRLPGDEYSTSLSTVFLGPSTRPDHRSHIVARC